MPQGNSSFDDRVAEYVDSPRLTCRMRYGKKVSARIQGNYGVYRTFVSPAAKKLSGGCTCPSEIWPCKHIHALRETWSANPESFFDLVAWLKQMARRSKEELVESMGMMVIEVPELLELFGVEGFEANADDEYEDSHYD
jgi:uncharacterized Zn finger protein